MDKKIFISYKRVNKDRVFQLVEGIKQRTSIDCWIDMSGIESGDLFKNTIIKAINDCDIVLFMLSRESIAIPTKGESWTQKEVNYALTRGKRVIPILIDGTTVNDCDWLCFDCSGIDSIDSRDKGQWEKLLRNLCGWCGTTLKTGPSTMTTPTLVSPTTRTPQTVQMIAINYPPKIPETWKPWECYSSDLQSASEEGCAEAQYERAYSIIESDRRKGYLHIIDHIINPYGPVKRKCNASEAQNAEYWFSQAAAQGYKPAIESLAMLYYYQGKTQQALHYGLLSAQDDSLYGAGVAYKSYETLGCQQERLLMMERAVEILFQKNGNGQYLTSGYPLSFPEEFDFCLDLAIHYHKTDVQKAIRLMERVGSYGRVELQFALGTYYEEIGQQKKAKEKFKYVAEHFGGDYKEMAIKKLGITARLSNWWSKLP